MRIIDTHSHLFGEEFDNDLPDVVARAKEAGVEKIFLPNINDESIPRMLELCRDYPGFFYPMLGLHPTDLTSDYLTTLDGMERMLRSCHPFIGIGEVGLDYYWDRTLYNEQQEAFDRQINWAVKYELPLMIHSRSAHTELVNILEPYKGKKLSGVFHSFCGNAEEASQLLGFDGFMLGINGVLTFKKSTLPEALAGVPLERIVLETDSPYLAPVPFRGKRNESAYIVRTLEKLADIYRLPVETVAEQTFQNALRVFVNVK